MLNLGEFSQSLLQQLLSSPHLCTVCHDSPTIPLTCPTCDNLYCSACVTQCPQCNVPLVQVNPREHSIFETISKLTSPVNVSAAQVQL